MLWALLAFVAATSDAVKNLFTKRALMHVDTYLVSISLWLFALPFLLLFLVYEGIPTVDGMFWIGLLVSGSLNIVMTILSVKAYKEEDISLVTPITSLTPIFILFTSFVLLGEVPSLLAVLGIVLVAAGTYFLDIPDRRQHFAAPLRSLFSRKGARYVLLATLLASVSSVFDKIGILHSSPALWSLSLAAFISAGMSPLLVRSNVRASRQHLGRLFLLGFLLAVVLCAQMSAFAIAPVAYVIAIKRTSILLTVVLGSLVLQEQHFRHRFSAALLMLLGAVCVSLG